MQSLVDVRRGDLVLDAGCGDGETMAWLGVRGARAVGLDSAFAMAALCRQRGFMVSVQDLEQPALRPCFDWVLCIGALEFTSNPRATVRNLAACLREEGSLALLFPRQSPLGFLYSLHHRSHDVRIHLFSLDEVLRFLAEAGLSGRPRMRHCLLSTLVVGKIDCHAPAGHLAT